MNKEEKKPIYSVIILRTDLEHIIVCESDDYDKCFEQWQSLHKNWQDSVSEEKPFVLKSPIVTAFNPVLIKEICVRPITTEVHTGKYENPYAKEMVKSGFSDTFNKFRSSSNLDILDEGYK